MPKAKTKTTVPDEFTIDPTLPLGPNQMVRLSDGWKYFGVRATQIDEHVIRGNIPAPISISDSKEKGKASRARGWLGSQIIAWQQARLAAAKPRPGGPRKVR
jgi:predicted DNA-binding transcriptional regulator AlpA